MSIAEIYEKQIELIKEIQRWKQNCPEEYQVINNKMIGSANELHNLNIKTIVDEAEY